MVAVRELLSADWSVADMRAALHHLLQRLPAWWLAEARLLVPDAVVARFSARGGPVIRLAATDDGVHVELSSVRRGGSRSALIRWADYSPAALDRHLAQAGLTRRDGALGIVLPPDAFFCRTLDVPVRARTHVHTLARQELERRTPFQADHVHLGMEIDPRPGPSQTMRVHQTIVRRDLVDAACLRLGLPPGELAFVASAPQDNGRPRFVSLRPDGDRDASAGARLRRALLAAAVVLACADVGLWWWCQERAIAAIAAQAAAEREKALTVRGLENDIARVRSSLQALEERRALPSTADLWRETSRILPDESWVTDWRLSQGKISTAGFSSKATELVALFERSPLFRDANLDAPITLDAVTGRERFSLVARTQAEPRVAQR